MEQREKQLSVLGTVAVRGDVGDNGHGKEDVHAGARGCAGVRTGALAWAECSFISEYSSMFWLSFLSRMSDRYKINFFRK